ncbi:hypothetical protein [Streptomyces sp. NPDC001933]|uniref:hypothetical protein n=1 Tax=Streptomyces sp. NPDC001933 TaxID=3364626 RepID=UPI0036CC8F2A
MTQTLVTAVATLLAVIAALEHLPKALTRLIQACMPLARAWQELKRAVAHDLDSRTAEDEPAHSLLDIDATHKGQGQETEPSPASDPITLAGPRSQMDLPTAQDPEQHPSQTARKNR